MKRCPKEGNQDTHYRRSYKLGNRGWVTRMTLELEEGVVVVISLVSYRHDREIMTGTRLTV